MDLGPRALVCSVRCLLVFLVSLQPNRMDDLPVVLRLHPDGDEGGDGSADDSSDLGVVGADEEDPHEAPAGRGGPLRAVGETESGPAAQPAAAGGKPSTWAHRGAALTTAPKGAIGIKCPESRPVGLACG